MTAKRYNQFWDKLDLEHKIKSEFGEPTINCHIGGYTEPTLYCTCFHTHTHSVYCMAAFF